MKKYSAIIIDDEDNNLLLLNHFISKFCISIDIINQAASIEEAIVVIDQAKPDILFLDIQLNDKEVFSLLDVIDFSDIEIIFVTAYDFYALKAFKYNAVDFILKPISIEDLILAVNKCIKRIEEKKSFEINSYYNGVENSAAQLSNFITISSIDKLTVIRKEEIIFCKSDGRYTTFYLNNAEEIVACKNLGEFEQALDVINFFRIHHSYIVNVNYIINIDKRAGYCCEMVNKIILPVAKRRQEGLNKFLKIKN
jgi:two-component system LytT family response regulator